MNVRPDIQQFNGCRVLADWAGDCAVTAGGAGKVEYGKRVIADLSRRLTERYGRGFSVSNLRNFPQFYLVYQQRILEIRYPAGSEFGHGLEKRYPAGSESEEGRPMGGESMEKQHPTGVESTQGFNPDLSWSHYRALMRVENEEARQFYEQEAASEVAQITGRPSSLGGLK